ncbi:MAG: hypothetical protein ACKO96_47430, partial [Flammeovirgaceae bacterium]
MARVNPRKPKYPVIYPPRRPNTGPTPVPFPQTPASGHSRPIPSHTSGETVSEHLSLKQYFKNQ